MNDPRKMVEVLDLGFRVQGSGVQLHRPYRIAFASSRRAFTLLEVLLALGLTAMVITLVGTAVNSTLRTVDSCRRRTEREQLARAIMQRIADDLRAVVRYEAFDDSGLNSSIGGGSSGGSSAAGGTNSAQSTSTNSSSQNSNSESSEDENNESADAMPTTPMAGIYGNQYQVQIDVTRIPRLDEYLYGANANTTSPRGDVRTVSYFLANSSNIAPAVLPAMATSKTTSNAAEGLARTEVDRATSLWQSTSTAQPDAAVILAPEVQSLEFRYFDGSQWLNQWDSTANGGVPRAVEISVYLRDDFDDSQRPSGTFYTAAGAMPTMDNPDNLYRLVVHLPAGLPLPAISTVIPEDDSQADSSNNNSSNTSGNPSPQDGQQ